VIDIFTALIGVGSICALTGAVIKILLAPPKVWDEDDYYPDQGEQSLDYNELRKQNLHIWMD
jgi:hypothetical protein